MTAIADDRIIIALDLPGAHQSQALADRLGARASFYKIGLGMLAGGGLDLARSLKAQGKRVFLDLKLFDIGATIESAARGAAGLGVDFLTVHGDPHVVAAARRGVGDAETKVLAVTILTSLDRSDLDAAMIILGDVADLVTERARRALAAGADGVIASPQESARIRDTLEKVAKLEEDRLLKPDIDAMVKLVKSQAIKVN